MKHTLAALLIAVPATLLSTGAMSAAGVVEAQPFTPGQTPAGGQSGNASSNDALIMLLDQFRELRSELETVRGIVEEQAYELRNLQRESMERYTDLDSRLSQISSASPAMPMATPPVAQSPQVSQGTGIAPAPSASIPVQNPSPGTQVRTPSATQVPAPGSASSTSPIQAGGTPMPVTSFPNSGATVAANNVPNTVAPLQPTVLSEQQQYQMALDSLLQEEQYQRAVTEFDQYLRLYPDGRFVTNAYYWKGQAYVNLAMLNEARESFETVVTQYPDGRKVDDAMYSLGTVYDKLGNASRAQQLLRQVQSRYPNTSAANLADIYLRAMN
tara:strand:+ start:452 stop:1435 length:984 start_codon:yes stop_codon:yes gene_type:complete